MIKTETDQQAKPAELELELDVDDMTDAQFVAHLEAKHGFTHINHKETTT